MRTGERYSGSHADGTNETKPSGNRAVGEAIAVRNAADDVPAAQTGQQGGGTPQLLVITADSLQATISLVALAEGEARFIAGSPAITTEPHRGIPGALDRLASQCGFALAEGMTGAVVIAGPPVALRIVGELGDDDAAAVGIAERYGVARAVESLTPPRRPARGHAWYQPLIEARLDGRIEALLVVLPPGALPLWAAQLLSALHESALPGATPCLVLTSDTDLAAALPPDTAGMPRGDHLAHRLIGALNRVRAARLAHRIPDDISLLSRPEALIAALLAVHAERGQPSVYLDVADGTTAILMDDAGAAVHHDPEIDAARGAMRLLHRCDMEQIRRWIPFALDSDALRTWALRRISWPMALLTDDDDRAIAAALARAALRTVLGTVAERIPDGAMWILGPSIARLGAQAGLRLVADLMPSVRVAVVARDDDDLIPTIGALALPYPADASSLLAHDALVPDGSVVRASLAGARDGITAILASDGITRTIEVASETLTAIACRGPATLTVTGREARSMRITVHGGSGGVLLDTRRRPLTGLTPNAPRPNVSGRLRSAATVDGALND
jgi:hypothetical protein